MAGYPKVTDSILAAQNLLGQTITIGGTSYKCLAGDAETQRLLNEDGGSDLRRNLLTDIRVAALPTAPAVGTKGTYLATEYRVAEGATLAALGTVWRIRWEAI